MGGEGRGRRGRREIGRGVGRGGREEEELEGLGRCVVGVWWGCEEGERKGVTLSGVAGILRRGGGGGGGKGERETRPRCGEKEEGRGGVGEKGREGGRR